MIGKSFTIPSRIQIYEVDFRLCFLCLQSNTLPSKDFQQLHLWFEKMRQKEALPGGWAESMRPCFSNLVKYGQKPPQWEDGCLWL